MKEGFEWDAEKEAKNLAKHGVSFSEASTVFGDRLAEIYDDPDHSDLLERREIIIGKSEDGRILLVSFTERSENVRIISAREATPKERR